MTGRRILLTAACVVMLAGWLAADEAYDLIDRDDAEGLKALIAKDPGLVSRVNFMGDLPLHTAAGRGGINCLVLLLSKGAKIEAKDPQGYTPLFVAANSTFKNSEKCVAALMKKGADYNALCEDIGYRPKTPLAAAFAQGKIEVIAAMLDNGVPANVKEAGTGKDLIRLAEQYDVTEGRKVLAYLFKRKIPIQGRGAATALHVLVANSSEHDFEQAFDKGVDVNAADETGRTALHIACLADKNYRPDQASRLNKIDLLIKHGAKVDAKDNDGETPLHLAAQNGLDEVIEEGLLDHGAKINEKGRGGATALHRAIWPDELEKRDPHEWPRRASGLPETVVLLIARKADINAPDAKGRTPLGYAVLAGNTKIMEILLANKANLNVKDADGNTLLHLAAGDGNDDVVTFLLERKLDPKARNNEGLTPLNIAVDAGYERAADLLRNRVEE